MSEHDSRIGGPLAAALYRILKAVARVALRRGVPYDAVAELAKRAFIDTALREFVIAGRKQTASRISVLTGVHRKEVARVLAAALPSDEVAAHRITCAAGVVAGWRRDERFADAKGKPAALRFETDDGASFSELVRRYGRGDIPARAVLDELVRVGSVTRLRDGRIRLVSTAYVPESASAEALEILGSDVADLIATIDHNLSTPARRGFFQRKTAYDNLPADTLAEIRAMVEREGQRALETLDAAMAKRDRDFNAEVKGKGRKRAMVGIYYFEDDVPEDDT